MLLNHKIHYGVTFLGGGNNRINEECLQILAEFLGFFKVNSMPSILDNNQLGISLQMSVQSMSKF